MRFFLVVFTAALLGVGCGSGDSEKSDDTTTFDVEAQDSTAVEVVETAEDAAVLEDIAALQDGDSPEDTGSELLGFGATCVEGGDCQEGVCHAFGNGGSLCTVSCVEAADCPEGSEGQKCNNKGVCKP
jgi:hypothetical protein